MVMKKNKKKNKRKIRRRIRRGAAPLAIKLPWV